MMSICVDIPRKLRRMLEQHERWIKSNHKRGKQLNLNHEYIVGVTFSWWNLAEADLRGAQFIQCDFDYTDLSKANIQGAYFECCRLNAKGIEDKADSCYIATSCVPQRYHKITKASYKSMADLAYWFASIDCDQPDVIKAQEAITHLANASSLSDKYGKL